MTQTRSTARRFRFSPRTLFVVLTMLACWLGWNLHVVHERQKVIATTRLEVGVEYCTEFGALIPDLWEPPITLDDLQPSLARRLMGDRPVVASDLPSALSSAEEVRRIQSLFPRSKIKPFPRPPNER